MLTFIASFLFYGLMVWYVHRREQLRLQEVRVQKQRQHQLQQQQRYD